MKLLFEIGNSTLKWAWLDAQSRFNFGGELPWPTGAEQTIEAVCETLPELNEVSVWVANVGSRAALYPLLKALQSRFGAYRMVFSEPTCCGVKNGYEDFSQLGVDRWLAMIAARRRSRAPNLLVVDAGTALTVDLLIKGQHQGGMIAPGLTLMQRCLTQNTANLAVALESSPQVSPDKLGLARTTRDGITAGSHYMAAAFLQTLYVDLQATLPDKQPLEVVLTGGQAEKLAQLVALPKLRCERHLALRGLAEVVKQAAASDS